MEQLRSMSNNTERRRNIHLTMIWGGHISTQRGGRIFIETQRHINY